MNNTIDKCGLCGSTDLNNLAYVRERLNQTLPCTIICRKCNAHWYLKWYTEIEWKAWINQKGEI